ncbi:MAG: HEPN family nuclease [Chloroflexi bacterium]|nr:HEPN family nuclease [Chloroflexota bacterium]
MSAYYGDVVRDFASRTRKNLRFIENSLGEPEVEVFEVTQLVNSMLGLLVFPQQEYVDRIPATPLAELEQRGWPHIRTARGFPTCETLDQLVRYLRNSIAHFNVRFIYNESGDISGVTLWNVDTRKRAKPRTWQADLQIDDLRKIVDRFLDMLESDEFAGK